MGSEVYRAGWEDEIDLRRLLEVLFRRKGLILGFVVLAVAVAGLLSFFILPPVYESSVVLQLPQVERGGEIDLTLEALSAMALSNSVLDQTNANLAGLPGIEAVRKTYRVKLEANARLLHIEAQGRSASDAHALVAAWTEAYQASVTRHMTQLTNERLTSAQSMFERRESELATAREKLQTFDEQYSLNVLEARLRSLENELTASETQLRDLQLYVIPEDEERLAYLVEELAVQPRAWETGQAQSSGGAPFASIDPSSGLIVSGTVLNPVYMQLNEELVAISQRLAANKKRLAALKNFIEEAPMQLATLRRDVGQLRTERDELTRAVSTASILFDQAEQEFHVLSGRMREAELWRPVVVSEPIVPVSPVAPRKMLNIALAAFLAAFVGVGTAFLLEIWNADGAKGSIAQ